MHFTLIDQIVDLQPGKLITAIKSVTLTEDYLRDHFPLFPVMPGVLMLEAMFQASAWLLRVTDDFSHSMVLLDEARTVKYAGFVRPGQRLELTSDLQKRAESLSWFRAKGIVDGEVVVSGRLVLRQFNLADTDEEQAATDAYICRCMRGQFSTLSSSTLATIT